MSLTNAPISLSTCVEAKGVVMVECMEHVDCPVCGLPPQVRRMSDADSARYVRCSACRTVYASPRSSRAERFAWLHETFGLGPYSLELADNRKEVLSAEAALIKKEKCAGKLLDIGCSTGMMFEYFSGSDWQLFGTEISPSAGDHASKTYNAQVHAGLLETAGFPDNYFDVVTMIDVFYYIDDPLAELLRIERLIRPDGLLAIEIPGQSYMISRSRGPLCLLMNGKWTRLKADSSYVNWYTCHSLEQLLRRSGFEAIRWEVVDSGSSFGIARLISGKYDAAVRRLGKRWPYFLNWAPKYLCFSGPGRKLLSVRNAPGKRRPAVP